MIRQGYSIKSIIRSIIQTLLSLIFFLILFNGVSQAQVTETTCYKDGRIVSWLECLTGNTTSAEIDKIKANIPFTAYQKYFEKLIVPGTTAEQAFNKTIQRIILDIVGLCGGIIVIGIIVMFGISVLQYATARDNEDAMKKSKKRIRSVFVALVIVIVFLIIGQVIATILDIGSIFDIELFKLSFATGYQGPN